MVVIRTSLAVCLCAALAQWQTAAHAQTGRVRAWVDNATQKVNEPFNIRIEASGADLGDPTIPPAPDLALRGPQMQQSMTLINGRMTRELTLTYSATARRPGRVVFPPVEIEIDGKTMRSDPVEITVLGALSNLPDAEQPVQAWVDSTTVTAGQPFRLYVEGLGDDVEIAMPSIVGLTINSINTLQSRTPINVGRDRTLRVQQGYEATASRPGAIQIPAIEVTVDGKTYSTLPFQMNVIEQRRANPSEKNELLAADLVFTEMYVDKEEVYQGEPILLTMEVWRIDHDRIESGSYRGADIRFPSTEGFYDSALEPVSRKDTFGAYPYNVNADRRILYPTTTGLLTIGTWHWEGLARWPSANSRGPFFHEEERYTLDRGPITINVKPLPERPPGFSGAVGQFTIDAGLSETSFLQGVPVKLSVTVRGTGNPDAIGEPFLAPADWAHVSSAQRETESSFNADQTQLVVAKHFTYTVTPLEAGPHTIPPISFTYFDPQAEEFKTESTQAFKLDVLPSAEGGQRLVVSGDVTLAQEGVAILGEDIRPLLNLGEPLHVRRPASAATPVLLLLPAAIYAILFAYSARLRRFTTDRAFARAYRAKATALKHLADVSAERDPSDALFRAVAGFVGDAFNVDKAGMTSADARDVLRNRAIDPGHAENIVKVLRACERARYASQPLTGTELHALMDAAEAAIKHIDGVSRRGSAA